MKIYSQDAIHLLPNSLISYKEQDYTYSLSVSVVLYAHYFKILANMESNNIDKGIQLQLSKILDVPPPLRERARLDTNHTFKCSMHIQFRMAEPMHSTREQGCASIQKHKTKIDVLSDKKNRTSQKEEIDPTPFYDMPYKNSYTILITLYSHIEVYIEQSASPPCRREQEEATI